MTGIFREIQTAIHESENEAWPDSWPVYVPHEYMDEITDRVASRSPQEVLSKGAQMYGRDVVPDRGVDKPIVLPSEPSELPLSYGPVVNAPRELVKKIVRQNATVNSASDSIRNVNTTTATARVFFNVCDTHRKLKSSKIERYNLPVSKGEFHKKPSHYKRVKLGQRISYTNETISVPPDNDFAIENLVDSVYNTIHSVHSEPIYQTRKRRFSFPYKVLDFTHYESVRIGTDYTHFGGVILTPLDVDVEKMDVRQANASV